MWFHNSMASCVVLRVSTFGTFSSTKRLQQPSVITAYVLFPTRATQLLRNLPLLISQWTCPHRQMMGAICFIIFINDGRFARVTSADFFFYHCWPGLAVRQRCLWQLKVCRRVWGASRQTNRQKATEVAPDPVSFLLWLQRSAWAPWHWKVKGSPPDIQQCLRGWDYEWLNSPISTRIPKITGEEHRGTLHCLSH